MSEAIKLPQGTVAHAQDTRVDYSYPPQEWSDPQIGGSLSTTQTEIPGYPGVERNGSPRIPAHPARKPTDKK